MELKVVGSLQYQIKIQQEPVIAKIITCMDQNQVIEILEDMKKKFGKKDFEKMINKEIQICAIGKIIYENETITE